MTFSFKNIIYSICIVSLMSCSKEKKEDKIVKNTPDMEQSTKILVGTYTSGSSEGIYSLEFNAQTGELKNPNLVAPSENPSFLTLDNDGEHVYAVNENMEGEISVFRWNEAKTELLERVRVSSEGKHPCYVSLGNNMLTVANYSSGNFSVFEVTDGKLKKNPEIRNHKGKSIVKPNQNEPHAHSSEFSKDGKFLYVADLGIDKIVGYTIDSNNKMGETFTALQMDAGDGPRHFVFHPSMDIVYIISEFSNTVTVATIDRNSGKFTKIDKKSTLPEDFTKESFCADIHISSDGQFLYASNRGHNSVAIFEVGADGTINLKGTEPTNGNWPRNFALSPDEKMLLVANQKSDNITVFKRDQKTGLLSFTGNQIKISKPVCLKF